jgi:hypothetical protein
MLAMNAPSTTQEIDMTLYDRVVNPLALTRGGSADVASAKQV